MFVIVKDGPDPTLEFAWDGDRYTRPENTIAVASRQELEVNGKTVEAYFTSGNSISVEINTWNEQVLDDSGSPESIITFPYNSPATYAITGGADADKFLVISGQLMFKERPSYDSPTDANGDSTYEVEVTATASGSSITKTINVDIAPAGDEASDPLDPPSQLPVFIIKEIPETIGDAEVPKNLVGTPGDDYIKVSADRFQYVHEEEMVMTLLIQLETGVDTVI